MQISAIEFIGAKYHDIECGLYLDELPDGYHEKQDGVYLVESDVKSTEIVKIS
tara:strand:+ start:347 stop:505 length:159 start_codon:yes stop_codon:yes gene_type:complete